MVTALIISLGIPREEFPDSCTLIRDSVSNAGVTVLLQQHSATGSTSLLGHREQSQTRARVPGIPNREQLKQTMGCALGREHVVAWSKSDVEELRTVSKTRSSAGTVRSFDTKFGEERVRWELSMQNLEQWSSTVH